MFLRISARRSRLAILIGIAALFLIGLIFTGFFARIRPDENLRDLFALIPQSFRGFIGAQYLDILSVRGFLAISYKHPLTLLALAGTAITIASRTPAGEIGSRSMDLILSHPVSRRTVIGVSLIVIWITSALCIAALFVGHVFGIASFGVPLDDYSERFWPVALHGWLFAGCLGTSALMISTLVGQRGRAVGWSAGLIGLFLLLDFGSQLGEPLEWMRFATPFGYYQPARIVLRGEPIWTDLIALVVASVLGAVTAWWCFARREIR